jgi:heterodisulfide reductase subunit A-like polyferredoxin
LSIGICDLFVICLPAIFLAGCLLFGILYQSNGDNKNRRRNKMNNPTIRKISVIGPGMMGHAIAQEFAVAGYEVMLCGRSEDRLQEAMIKIERSLSELAEWEIISENDVAPSLERFQKSADGLSK